MILDRLRSPEHLPTPWTLIKQAIRDYRANWRPLVTLLLIITVPVAILSNYGASPSSDNALAAYLAIAQLIMYVALIYAVVRILDGKVVSVRQAYYAGSAMLVRLMLVGTLLIFMGVFFFIGLAILAFGVVAPGTALTAGEQILLIILAIAVIIPSVILVTRGLWASYIIFESPKGPIQAIRQSRQLTRGRTLATLGRLLALLGFMIALVLVPGVVLKLLQNLTHWTIWLVILQIVATLIVLPTATFYLYRYYQGLK